MLGEYILTKNKNHDIGNHVKWGIALWDYETSQSKQNAKVQKVPLTATKIKIERNFLNFRIIKLSASWEDFINTFLDNEDALQI